MIILKSDTVVLSLDLSTSCSGYAVMTNFGQKIIECGQLKPDKYPGYTADKYPKSTLKRCRSIADQVKLVIAKYRPNYVVYEEINPGSCPSIIATKSLSFLQCMIMYDNLDILDTFHDIKTSQWRSILGIKNTKKTANHSNKQETVDYVNAKYGTSFALDDNDVCDAIAEGLAFMIKNKGD